MTREIAFRIWDTQNKEFLDSHIASTVFAILSSDDSQEKSFGVSVENYKDGRYVVQQFTGLRSKSGNKIYEGDIFNTKAARWVVVFEDGAFWAKVIWSQVLPVDYTECLFIMTNDMVPLGNILENPELLIV